MPAYVISDVVGLDADLVARYRSLAALSIDHHGGRYLTRVGAAVEPVEGDWAPANVVILEFPSMARAREWYASPEYAEALEVRRAALRRNLIFVDGAG